MNLKGELQIQETLLVLFVCVLLLLTGMIGFYKYQQAHLLEEERRLTELAFDVRILELLHSPLLTCSVHGERSLCWDVTKLPFFSSSLGFMNVTLREIYPSENPTLCTSSSLSSCGTWQVYSNVPKNRLPLVREVPLALYYPYLQEYHVGIARFEVYP